MTAEPEATGGYRPPPFLPRPAPDFFPLPDSLLTVAQARRSASFDDTPRFF